MAKAWKGSRLVVERHVRRKSEATNEILCCLKLKASAVVDHNQSQRSSDLKKVVLLIKATMTLMKSFKPIIGPNQKTTNIAHSLIKQIFQQHICNCFIEQKNEIEKNEKFLIYR